MLVISESGRRNRKFCRHGRNWWEHGVKWAFSGEGSSIEPLRYDSDLL